MTLDDEIRRLLTGPNLAHVATVMADGAPHVAAVWVDLEGDDVVFIKERGSLALRNLRRDPRVAISVVDHGDEYRLARIRGRAVELREDQAAAMEHLDRLSERYIGRPYPTAPSDEMVTIVCRAEQATFERIEGFSRAEG